MSGVNFNPATQYVVRNDRTHYTENPKPAYDKVASEGIVGYATINYSKDGKASEALDRAEIDRKIEAKLEEWIKNNKGGAKAKAPTL